MSPPLLNPLFASFPFFLPLSIFSLLFLLLSHFSSPPLTTVPHPPQRPYDPCPHLLPCLVGQQVDGLAGCKLEFWKFGRARAREMFTKEKEGQPIEKKPLATPISSA
jgi:hypothetical protein